MSGAAFDPASYRTWLRMSRDRHLLVEGRDDKQVFELFLEALSRHPNSAESIRGVVIDVAENLIDFGTGVGNREKVERVCESVSGSRWAERLVGFVDRDFRGFERGAVLRDSLQEHRVSGRVVWSRGHSIENYYFDFDTLRQPLCALSDCPEFRKALSLFEVVFEPTVRLACAASLAGEQLGKLGLVKGSADQAIFEICPGEEGPLAVDVGKWRGILTGRHHATSELAQQLVERFLLWNAKVRTCDFRVVRWLCHGHVGLAYIWAAYSACVLEACRREGYGPGDAAREARRVLQLRWSARFGACAGEWVRRALGNHCLYPVEVFRLLGVPTPTR